MDLSKEAVAEVHVADGESYNDARTQDTRDTRTRVRRLFSFVQIFFFALSYMSSWEAMSTNIGLVFWNGGPRAMVWGFFIVIPGVLCQVASLCELASNQPIAGAQYHWTFYLAPPQWRRPITWFQGWITWFSWIALLAGVVNIAANVTTTLASFSHTDYVVKGWHTVLIMYAYLTIQGLMNMYMFWIIPWVEVLAGLLHVSLWIVFAALLLGLAPQHTSDFVFFEKSNLSGWDDDFISFNLGIILITWGFVGYDAVVHVSEEVRRAGFAVPRAIFWSIVTNSVLAFGMVLIFFYCLGPVDDILAAIYPLMTICIYATQSVAGASAMLAAILCTIVATSLGSITSTSRLTWALARDGYLPSYFARIDPKYRIPVRSVWLPILIVMLLSLLNLVNYTAFSVIISLSTFGLYQSYFLAIGCALYSRLSGEFKTAPWPLGRFDVPINAFALLYTGWTSIFMVFPNYLPVTAAYMNYALPINAFAWIVALVLWYAWGKKHWRGLNRTVVEIVVNDAERNTKD